MLGLISKVIPVACRGYKLKPAQFIQFRRMQVGIHENFVGKHWRQGFRLFRLFDMVFRTYLCRSGAMIAPVCCPVEKQLFSDRSRQCWLCALDGILDTFRRCGLRAPAITVALRLRPVYRGCFTRNRRACVTCVTCVNRSFSCAAYPLTALVIELSLIGINVVNAGTKLESTGLIYVAMSDNLPK
jgi:hypothetical protein